MCLRLRVNLRRRPLVGTLLLTQAGTLLLTQAPEIVMVATSQNCPGMFLDDRRLLTSHRRDHQPHGPGHDPTLTVMMTTTIVSVTAIGHDPNGEEQQNNLRSLQLGLVHDYYVLSCLIVTLYN